MKDQNNITDIELSELSYYDIVSLLQGDTTLAKRLLLDISIVKELVDNEYLEAEIELQRLNTKRLKLIRGANLVIKHIKKETPIIIQGDGRSVTIESKDIIINKNVI